MGTPTPRRQARRRRQNYKLEAVPLTLGSPTFETSTLKQVHSLAPFEHQLKASDFTLSPPTYTPPEQPTTPASPPVATPPPPPDERWRKSWPEYKVKAAALAAAKTYQSDDPPTAAEWKAALEKQLGGPVARDRARDALRRFAPHLQRKPGHKRNRGTSSRM
jgi:hypothetical protein